MEFSHSLGQSRRFKRTVMPRRTAGALPTAISCLVQILGPAARPRGWLRHRRRPKTLFGALEVKDKFTIIEANLGVLKLPDLQVRAINIAYQELFRENQNHAVGMACEEWHSGDALLLSKDGLVTGFAAWLQTRRRGRDIVAFVRGMIPLTGGSMTIHFRRRKFISLFERSFVKAAGGRALAGGVLPRPATPATLRSSGEVPCG